MVKLPCGGRHVNSFTSEMLSSNTMGDEAVANEDGICSMILKVFKSKRPLILAGKQTMCFKWPHRE